MQHLYQGEDPGAGVDYNSLLWRLSLLTQTNSSNRTAFSGHVIVQSVRPPEHLRAGFPAVIASQP